MGLILARLTKIYYRDADTQKWKVVQICMHMPVNMTTNQHKGMSSIVDEYKIKCLLLTFSIPTTF